MNTSVVELFAFLESKIGERILAGESCLQSAV